MLRFATSILLCQIVIVCPYLCLGELTLVSGETTVNPCGCCASQGTRDTKGANGEQKRGQTPLPANGNDSDCLCKGAIMDVVRSVDFEPGTPLTVDWITDDSANSSDSISMAETSSQPPHSFPPLSTGRDICALICVRIL